MNENSLEQLNEAEFELVDLSSIELKLQNDLDVSLKEFEFLEEEKKKIGNPDALGNVVFDEITNQFGRQLGLDLTNDTLINIYDNKHPNENYDVEKNAVLKDPKYKQIKNQYKQYKEEGKLVDAYTHKTLTDKDTVHPDHVISRREIFDDPRRKQAGLSTSDLANIDENLKPVNANLNESKQDNRATVYYEKNGIDNYVARKNKEIERVKKSNLTAEEKVYEINKLKKEIDNVKSADKKAMINSEKKAEAKINVIKTVNIAGRTFGKAVLDVIKIFVAKSLVDLLKEIVSGLIKFLKNVSKSFKTFLLEIKEAFNNFFNRIKNEYKKTLNVGVISSITTIVSEIIGPIFSVFSKLSSIIKLGVNSFIDAIKWLKNPQNKDKPFEIKIAQVGKIVVGALVAAGALFSGELFANILNKIPGFQIYIPGLDTTFSRIVGTFIASIISGVIGAMVLNLIDKYIADRLSFDNKKSRVELNNEILNKQNIIEKVVTKELDYTKKYVARNITESNKEAENLIKGGAKEIFNNPSVNNVRKEKLNNIQNIQNELDKKLKDIQGV